jgi:hypothetical protein
VLLLLLLLPGYTFWLAATADGELYTCDNMDDGYAGAQQQHSNWLLVDISIKCMAHACSITTAAPYATVTLISM